MRVCAKCQEPIGEGDYWMAGGDYFHLGECPRPGDEQVAKDAIRRVIKNALESEE